jgi:collagen type VII alpha
MPMGGFPRIIRPSTGSSGIAGPQGDTGAIGPQGLPGFTGVIGFTGIGNTGMTGSAGSAGPTGPKGDTGSSGSQGLQGFTGIRGEGGNKGDTGSSGSEGPTGKAGDKGDSGISFVWHGNYSTIHIYNPNDIITWNGNSYICILLSNGNAPTDTNYWTMLVQKGDTGSSGSSGSTGATGPKGDTGSSGSGSFSNVPYVNTSAPGSPSNGMLWWDTDDSGGSVAQGPKGDTGSSGSQGAKGNTGSSGSTGAKGDTGSSGSSGTKGDTGSSGSAGAKGDTGSAGSSTIYTARGTWAPFTPYYVNDIVYDNYYGWICVQNNSGTDQPVADAGDHWKLFVAAQAGAKGDTGSAGSIGATGATGSSGGSGSKGDTGSSGSAGPKGNTGSSGSAGPKGDTGSAGSAGSKGDTGSTGSTGQVGHQGDQGDTGVGFNYHGSYSGVHIYFVNDVVTWNGNTYICIQTSNGNLPSNTSYWTMIAAKGDTGSSGSGSSSSVPYVNINPPGSPTDGMLWWDTDDSSGSAGGGGAKGDTGSSGSQGPKGDTGSSGSAGPRGDTGSKGDEGKVGASGPTGSSGSAGPKGDTGSSGSNGAKGDTGNGLLSNLISSVKQSGDVTNSSGSAPSNVSGLAFTLTSGERYYFKFVVQGQSAATGTGLAFTFTAPSMTFAEWKVKNQQAAGGTDQYYENSSNTITTVLVSASVVGANTDYIFIIEGICQPSANGTLQLQCRSEVALSQITVKNGVGYLINSSVSSNQGLKGDTGSAGSTPFLKVPLSAGSWSGGSYSTTAATLLDLSTVFGVPAGVKGINVRLAARDSAAVGTTGLSVSIGPSATYYYNVSVPVIGGNVVNSNTSPCSCDDNGDIYYRIVASGVGTMDIWLEIWGYWL